MASYRQEGDTMKRFLILALVVALALILVVPVATAETKTESNGVTVINGDAMAPAKTQPATIKMVEKLYPAPVVHVSTGKGIGPVPD